jgi:hypothetical protein
MRPARLYSVYALIVGFGAWLASHVLGAWFDARIDEQITEGTPKLIAFVVVIARWGISHPVEYTLCALLVWGLVVGLMLFVWHLSTRAMVSIDVGSYLSKHVTSDGRCYVVAPDVTVTNNRRDRSVSVGAEFVVDEKVEMAATNATNGPTEIVHCSHKCQPEVLEPPLTSLSSGAHFIPKKALELPLNVGPNEAKRGYIAFRVWDKTLHEDVPDNRNAGTLVFTDYGTQKVIRKFPKSAHYLLGTYGGGQVRPTPPRIDASVSSGTRPLLTVRSNGGAFKLVARARILGASEPIDNRAVYEFQPRDVSSGDGVSSFTLATISARRTAVGATAWVVKIHGELMSVVQRWEGVQPFACDLAWEFFHELFPGQIKLGVAFVRLSLSADRRSLDAAIVSPPVD